MRVLQQLLVQTMGPGGSNEDVRQCDDRVSMRSCLRIAMGVENSHTQLAKDGVALRAAPQNRTSSAQSTLEALDSFFEQCRRRETELHLSATPPCLFV